jgi:hypothetical protein
MLRLTREGPGQCVGFELIDNERRYVFIPSKNIPNDIFPKEKSLNAIIPNAPNDPQGLLQWVIQGATAPCTPALGLYVHN